MNDFPGTLKTQDVIEDEHQNQVYRKHCTDNYKEWKESTETI